MKFVFSLIFQVFIVHLSLTNTFKLFASPVDGDSLMGESTSTSSESTCRDVFSGPPDGGEYSLAIQEILTHTEYAHDLMKVHLVKLKVPYGKRILSILDRIRTRDNEMRAFAAGLMESIVRTGWDDGQSASWETVRFSPSRPLQVLGGCVVFSGTFIATASITGNPLTATICSTASAAVTAYLLREREHTPNPNYLIQTYDTGRLLRVLEAFEDAP